MRTFLLNVFNGRVVSPWWILLIDMGICINAYIIAFVLRINVQLSYYSVSDMVLGATVVQVVYLASFLLFGSYRGVIRHSNYNEFRQLTIACFTAFLVLILCHAALQYVGYQWFNTPRLVLVFHFLLTAMLSFLFRMLVKETYSSLTKKNTSTNVFIYGAGEMGQITLEAIRSDKENQYNVVGIIDDNLNKWNMVLHSVPVMNWEKALKVGKAKRVEVVILAINHISVQRKHEITDACLDKGWKLKVMPSVGNWVNGISNQKQIRDIRIEDILGREEIRLNQLQIMDALAGKVVAVSGAAGSIGSEIVRQLLRFPVRKIVMVDIAESALYDLQQELLLSHSDAPFSAILADVTNEQRMREVFEQHRPQIVFNAAAYKHVPLLEEFPYEAIRVNIGGVKTLADLAIEYQVDKFVMVSTDKAVNPTNVMGASKRICEIYIQALSQLKNTKTEFVTTRFGNVLGSNGSVVPLFKKQIERGGPITVTHKEITRYFMTIPEACQLVLEAGFMGRGGEIFVFDMGDPVKIDDLAKEMIRLSGLKLGEDITIAYTGLRPGEKLYEELLASKENTMPTHHEKIMIAKVREYKYASIKNKMDELLLALKMENNEHLVSRMKDLVPEYKSQNSLFCQLDKKLVH
ncbi:NDP-sugar epimerase, includes UDP-GlcNAc-inverting 4,6-dehydratase FlaA1 and capsular polysaccharide biosynthesis protein EpsC [Saccharicrinis carchari]|uniref:NDP-sugar epimerase, includes UDP-GlcNAc-inverting 4,6-dehydratase FlaA1 and capsular polysaccharide biosynthesis protein EpsC n=1 Tax=Saccharicrinis carchari TaxID=1168039 RepID=A0A521BUH4_SACCC|nr:nucleoside-diphosphate sugar epimerase/dehydratase [Saccharicrinis carchari]SMO50803.1 NDP-sugar epimerase, includes UDP-GlcNAc-inverting 4,6-dehydratase FlaA1 and capsular polysaccharide biosynthesis protein EpsC [Saccharicrinis carchari]